ncbi:hypothetical protein ACI77J_01465 [Pseudomonas sp. O64]|uniref:hypothetical protein n=1 Tax=Pseudomonas TaxID=286 RepID=UPI000B9FCED5|nr:MULTISPECIES: hypothetical protein [unclassified Pseudomonas]MCV2225619.1 hypothetical protein [Pseudomonas sp. AU10]OZO06529.1 hypothetical protein B7453_00605 [Pseudomonas sp. IB20]UNM19846.1 hypothetical protein K0P33_30920 [Pseudomonas sp. ArH3a]UXZ22605.1 hypothetical protein KZH41_29850 [Pseudomonas sp. YeP6b]
MANKLKNLPLALLCTVLAVPDAWAENCRLSLSQPRIDYGAIRREARVESASLVLGTRSLRLSVLCTEPAAIALRFIGIAADGQGFQFGRQGRFRLTLKHAQVDGHAVGWVAAQLPGEPASGQLLPGQTLMARIAGMPLVGRQLTAQVDIDTELPADALHVRDETRLEGLGSFELVSPAVPPSQ